MLHEPKAANRAARLQRSRFGHPVALVVDSQECAGDSVAKNLRGQGFLVYLAKSVGEAFAVIEATPDIVLAVIDANLTDGSGFAVVSRLRRRGPSHAILTHSGDLGQLLEIGRGFGITDVQMIPKHPDLTVLRRAVASVLQARPQVYSGRELPDPGESGRAFLEFLAYVLLDSGGGESPEAREVLAHRLGGASTESTCAALGLPGFRVRACIARVLEAHGIRRLEMVLRPIGRLLDEMGHLPFGSARGFAAWCEAMLGAGDELVSLPPSEVQLLRDLLSGQHPRSIAARQGVSVRTIASRSRALWDSLGANSTFDLLRVVAVRTDQAQS